MDFEKIYQKYKDGTATEEEKKLVEEEIRKAKMINDLLEEKSEEESAENCDVVSKQFDSQKIKEALKYFNIKQFIKTTVIVVVVVVALSVLAVGTIFGIAFYNANASENITQEQAVALAKESMATYLGTTPDKIMVGEVDKDIEMSLNLTKSRYVYEVEMTYPDGEYTFVVNTESGYVRIDDFDSPRHRDFDFDLDD